jgi:uncharacterized protein (DUF2141 family)
MMQVFRIVLMVCVVMCTAPVVALRQQNLKGTASVVGRVLDHQLQPAWGATVAIRSRDSVLTKTTVTDANGSFEFRGLPPGKFLVRALRAGYLPADFGSSQFGKPPQPLALEGDTQTELQLVMTRGASVSGRILQREGVPAVGIDVVAITRQQFNGQLRYVSAGRTKSDDRGTYRLYGLPPATYAVVASLSDLTSSRAPIERGLADDVPADPLVGLPSAMDRQLPPNLSAAYQNVFYPGSTDPSLVEWITLAAGDDKALLDFALPLARGGAVGGEVLADDGARVRGARITIAASLDNLALGAGDFSSRNTTSSDGRFMFAGLQPGSYTMVATTANRDGAATARVRVTGESTQQVRMHLRAPARFAGRIRFETSAERLPAYNLTRVTLRPAGPSASELRPLTVQPDANGLFLLSPVAPGTYVVDSTLQGPSPRLSEWRIKSVVAGERHLRSGPFQISEGQTINDVELVLTDISSEVDGRLVRAGTPITDAYVLLFAVDRTLWWAGSGHMRAPIRPATDGTFRFNRLPAGKYYLAAVSDFDMEAWHERTFLESLLSTSLVIELKEGEHKTYDFPINN